MEEKTDKELYQEFLKGNNSSFEKLVIRHKNKLIYFITNYVKNVDTAEDITQDVFVYILIHKTNYDFKYSLKTYLYTIAKSKALNYIKREKKITYTEEKQIIEQQENTNNSNEKELETLEEIIFKKEKAQSLRNTIKKLKKEYAQAIYLADIEELSYKEIRKNTKKIHREHKSFNSQSEKITGKISKRGA